MTKTLIFDERTPSITANQKTPPFETSASRPSQRCEFLTAHPL